jgi:hypothetical protein
MANYQAATAPMANGRNAGKRSGWAFQEQRKEGLQKVRGEDAKQKK